MSRGIISIGGENYYKVANQELTASNKTINFKLTGDNSADHKFTLGSNNDTSSFQVQDSDGNPGFKLTGGGNISFQTVSKLPISTDPVGRKGDLKLVAKTDNESASTSIILHHDTSTPTVTIQALNQRVTTVSSITNADDITYTPSQIIGGIIERDPNGDRRTDTFPSGTNLINSLYGVKVGDTLEIMITNLASLTAKGGGDQEYIDLDVGSNAWVASSGQTSLLPGETKMYKLVVTNVGSPAYSIYLLGSSNRKINNWYGLWWDWDTVGGNNNININTSVFSDVFSLIDNSGLTVLSIPSTPQMFDSSTVSIVKNRGPSCKVKVVGRIYVALKNESLDNINVELAISKNDSVINSSKMGAILEYREYGSPQINTMAIVDLAYNDNIKLVLALISGASPGRLRIWNATLLITQIDN